jgi:hypothetical protein
VGASQTPGAIDRVDAGIEVHRRPDANPFAVLGITLPELPAAAVQAAE